MPVLRPSVYPAMSQQGAQAASYCVRHTKFLSPSGESPEAIIESRRRVWAWQAS